MVREEAISKVLERVYKTEKISLYDTCFDLFEGSENHLAESKAYADELIDEKLAKYIDEKKTLLEITNYGKFWMLKGGYIEYLKQCEKKSKNRETSKEDDLEDALLEARLKFTQYRIKTFWITFVLSILGFIFSLVSLCLVYLRLK